MPYSLIFFSKNRVVVVQESIHDLCIYNNSLDFPWIDYQIGTYITNQFCAFFKRNQKYCYYSVLDNEYDKPSLIPLFTKSTYVLRESTIVQQQCSVFGNIVVPKKKSQDLHKVYINFTDFFFEKKRLCFLYNSVKRVI